MSDLYESGLNPVDADTGSKDIYFSNEDFAKKIRDGKKASNAALFSLQFQWLFLLMLFFA